MSLDHHHEAGPGHRLERMVFFSDAVFAIAITLLVIELHPPHLHMHDSLADQADALLALAPNLMGFLISFFVVGAFWAGHHRIFALAGRWDERLYRTNLLFLLTIVAMPFITAFMSNNAFARLPVSLYCAWLLLAAIMNIGVQRHVLTAPVLHDAADPARVSLSVRRGRSVALGATTALLVSLVVPFPAIALAFLMTMPLWRLVLERTERRSAPPQRQPDQPA